MPLHRRQRLRGVGEAPLPVGGEQLAPEAADAGVGDGGAGPLRGVAEPRAVAHGEPVGGVDQVIQRPLVVRLPDAGAGEGVAVEVEVAGLDLAPDGQAEEPALDPQGADAVVEPLLEVDLVAPRQRVERLDGAGGGQTEDGAILQVDGVGQHPGGGVGPDHRRIVAGQLRVLQADARVALLELGGAPGEGLRLGGARQERHADRRRGRAGQLGRRSARRRHAAGSAPAAARPAGNGGAAPHPTRAPHPRRITGHGAPPPE